MKAKRTRLALIVALVLSTATATTSAAEPAAKSKPPAKSSTTSDLDRELLQDLGDEPAAKPKPMPAPQPAPTPKKQSPRAKPATKPAASSKSTKPKGDDSLDDELLKDLGDNEPAKSRSSDDASESTAGGGDANDPLERITRQMREVERRMRSGDSDAATQDLERKIVEEIDKLIKQARQQSSSSSSSKSKKPGQTSTREQASQPTPSGKQGSGAQQASGPARDSTDRVGKPPEVKKPDMAKVLGLLKDVWGELPPRVRQQMMQSSVEKFVPKYEFEIEEYFKTLAERREDQP